jgi:hypothetical protein
MFDFLFDSRYQGIATFILGAIISSILTFISVKLTSKNSKLTYESGNEVIIDRNNLAMPNELNLFYKNEQIVKLVRTVMYFWNSGNKTIRKEDLENGDKLRIELPNDTKIYSYKILKNTDKSNNFELYLDKNNILIYFNHLEPENGVKLEILHNNESISAKISGKVIELKGDITNSKDRIYTKLASLFDFVGFIGSFCGAWGIGVSFFIVCTLIYQKVYKSDYLLILGFLGSTIISMIIAPVILKLNKKGRTHPAKLD